jgi:hypothetical protein
MKQNANGGKFQHAAHNVYEKKLKTCQDGWKIKTQYKTNINIEINMMWKYDLYHVARVWSGGKFLQNKIINLRML